MTESLPNITEEICIDASPERVWTFLTEPEHVQNWLGCMRYRKQIGHLFYMQQDPHKRSADDISGATHCRILKLDAPSLFAFSWFVPGTPETEVHISLKAENEHTVVTLNHIGWEQFQDAEPLRSIHQGLKGGWKSFVLPQLKQAVE